MLELLIEVSREQAEQVSDNLFEAGALSVTIEDVDADAMDEQALYGEPGHTPTTHAWAHNRVIALCADEAQAAQLTVALSQVLPQIQPHYRAVPDTDWVRATQSQFAPIKVGRNLWIAPSWHSATVAPKNAVTIELDPGMAFGTGSHPTTHLCLAWLEENIKPNQTVLDYGCGSGILAIAAKKLGAGRVIGVDIDAQAVAASHANAQKNQCEIEAYLPEEKNHWNTLQFDVVVANILSSPLKVLAPMLVAKLAKEGRLVLSGVLARQADEVIAAYAPHHPLTVWQTRDGWVCLASAL